MIQTRLLALSVLLTLASSGASFAQETEEKQAARRDRLQEEGQDYFRQWLEQDVLYVISPEEKEVFRKLRTTEEKEQFIEQFWYRRDPDSPILDVLEKEMLLRALRREQGNQVQAARLLRLSRDTLRYRIKKFELDEAG